MLHSQQLLTHFFFYLKKKKFRSHNLLLREKLTFFSDHVTFFKDSETFFFFFLPSISLHVLCPVQGSKSCSRAFLLSLLNVPNLHPLLQYRIHGCKISSSWRHLLSFNIPRYCRFSVVRVLFPFKVYGFSKLVLPVYK